MNSWHWKPSKRKIMAWLIVGMGLTALLGSLVPVGAIFFHWSDGVIGALVSACASFGTFFLWLLRLTVNGAVDEANAVITRALYAPSPLTHKPDVTDVVPVPDPPERQNT